MSPKPSLRVAASKSPRLRTRVGSDAVWVPRLKAIVPSAMFYAKLRRRFGLGREEIMMKVTLLDGALAGDSFVDAGAAPARRLQAEGWPSLPGPYVTRTSPTAWAASSAGRRRPACAASTTQAGMLPPVGDPERSGDLPDPHHLLAATRRS